MEIQELAEKLKNDGIAKGKEEGDKIIAQAEEKAEQIVDKAKNQAQGIIADAEKEAESLLENGKQNLRLAARDVLMKLRQDLSMILQDIVVKDVSASLNKAETLKHMLETLMAEYRKQGGTHIEIPAGLGQELKDWLTGELKATITEREKLSGFCLHEPDGGKIEVTADSVREVLLPFLGSFVKDLVEQEKCQ